MRNCHWCEEEAVYTFVGRTFDDEYQVIILCELHKDMLHEECMKQNVVREEGMAKKLFSFLGE